jgi:HlyD family secretion protein
MTAETAMQPVAALSPTPVLKLKGPLRVALTLRMALTLLLALTLGSCKGEGPAGISASGTIEVVDVTVSAKVPGEVVRRYVDEGSVVHAGDTLALIRHLTAPLELKQAETAVASARAAYALLRRGSREEDIRQAKATMDNLAIDYERMGVLFQDSLISSKEYHDAETRLTVAKEAYEKLKNGPLPEELERAKAQVAEAEAQVNLVRQKIYDSQVISPANGVVTLRAVEQGEMVQAGSAIVRVSVLEKVRLVIFVREADLGKLKVGDAASVSIDAYPGKTFPGRVIFISPTAEFTPKNVQTKEERVKLSFAVKLEVENPGGELKPGMPADAVIGDAAH